MGSVPTIDLTPWFGGTAQGRASVAAQMDSALQSVGFFLVTGHGVSRADRAAVRAAAREFFALPTDVKHVYAVTVGGRGWLPPGVEANGFAEGTQTPPDMKESYSIGADSKTEITGDADIDGFWFSENVWPTEVPALQTVASAYLVQMRALAETLLSIAESALSQQPGFFTDKTTRSTHTMNINRYPPAALVGEPEPGQFRIGPHTDFGTFTILDREPGRGGLQVWSPDDDAEFLGGSLAQGWEDAPYDPDAFTINTGDLLARWSGDRWKSNRHRVLPPQAEAPDEDLVSLVYFYEANWNATVESLQPPVGKTNDYPPVMASDFLKRLLDAITVG